MRTIILLLTLSTAGWSGDSLIDRRLRDAITAMASNPVPGAPSSLERGVRLLVADGALEDHVEQVMKDFNEAFAMMGRPQAVEEIGVRPYGNRSEVAYFIVPCERGAVFLRVVAVKRGDNQRIVSSMSVSTRPELVLPPGLLEPEPIRR
jgi:hypothetical protein